MATAGGSASGGAGDAVETTGKVGGATEALGLGAGRGDDTARDEGGAPDVQATRHATTAAGRSPVHRERLSIRGILTVGATR
jgi:hypothetical protein